MIRFLKMPAILMAAALALSACASPGEVSRNAPLDFAPVIEVPTQDWAVSELVVNVPRSLTVSEANGIKPSADIVWREDALGDRHMQVQSMIYDALYPAVAPLGGQIPVVIELDVTRFHAVTERARYTIGGEHEIEFVLTVRHAETGEILSGPRDVDLTFRAYGGQQAIDAEAQGITQRVRISERLYDWARIEFPMPQPSLLTAAVY